MTEGIAHRDWKEIRVSDMFLFVQEKINKV
jgi:hypothetical protein